MKHFCTTLALLLAVVFAAGAQGFRSVAVNLKNGTKLEVNLSQDMKAFFSEGQLFIQGEDTDVSVLQQLIESFVFSSEESSLSELDAADIRSEVAGGCLNLYNLPEGSVVTVFNVAGAVVLSEQAAGQWSVALSELPSGVAVVKVNEVSFKIATRK